MKTTNLFTNPQKTKIHNKTKQKRKIITEERREREKSNNDKIIILYLLGGYWLEPDFLRDSSTVPCPRGKNTPVPPDPALEPDPSTNTALTPDLGLCWWW